MVHDAERSGRLALVRELAFQVAKGRHGVGGLQVEREAILLRGCHVRQDRCPGLRARLLEAAGDARDRVAVRAEQAAFVAARAERARGVDLGPGIGEDHRPAQHDHVGSDVIVVVEFGIVTALERDPECPFAAVGRPADVDPRIREPRAERTVGRTRGLPGGRRHDRL